MGKTYRRDARNDGWRKAKHARQHHQGGNNHKFDQRAWREVTDEQQRRDEKHGLYGGLEDVAN